VYGDDVTTRKTLSELKESKNRYTVEKVYGRNHDLVNRYGISVSQMTMDMYQLSKALAGNFLIHDFR
jgi:hypothetical protein